MPGKNSGSGPMAALNEAELNNLRDEVSLYQKVDQKEIDSAVDMWFKVYHCLDFFVAAQTGKGLRILNVIDDQGGFIQKPDSYLIPAFYLEEGEDGESGWIFKDIANEFDTNKNSITFGLDFTTYLDQKVENENTPILKLFLEEAAEHSLPTDFSPADCRQTCLISVDQMQDKHYIEMALDLIDQLWEPAKNQLTENKIDTWLVDILSSDDIGEWLKSQLDITIPFLTSLDELFDNEDELERRKEISQLVAVLAINTKTFNRIYHRFIDEEGLETSNGLKVVMNNFVGDLSEQNHKDAWQNLLAATYRAVAWQIYQQVNRIVDEIRTVLPVDED